MLFLAALLHFPFLLSYWFLASDASVHLTLPEVAVPELSLKEKGYAQTKWCTPRLPHLLPRSLDLFHNPSHHVKCWELESVWTLSDIILERTANMSTYTGSSMKPSGAVWREFKRSSVFFCFKYIYVPILYESLAGHSTPLVILIKVQLRYVFSKVIILTRKKGAQYYHWFFIHINRCSNFNGKPWDFPYVASSRSHKDAAAAPAPLCLIEPSSGNSAARKRT